MHFAGRDLKPYSEPVTPRELVEGCVYFCVTFADDDMLIPIVEPVVYVGTSLSNDREEGKLTDTVYFEDIVSYRQENVSGTATEAKGKIFEYCPEEMKNIFTFDHALDLLLACSVRRAQKEL